MEEITICPQCNNIIISEKCNMCDYTINNDKLLIDIIYSEYNKAIELLKNKSLMEAWEKMKDAIMLFPYLLTPLKFCYYLSMAVGEYQRAVEFLKKIKPFILQDEYKNLSKFLSDNIKTYNSILENNYVDNPIDELSFIHLYILDIQQNRNYNSDSIKKYLNNYNLIFDKNRNKKIVKYSLVSGAIIIILIFTAILIILSNRNNISNLTNENNILQRRQIVLAIEKKELENKLKEQKSIDFFLSKFSEFYTIKNYLECSEILIINPQLITHIESLNQSYIIEQLCRDLYYSGNYDAIIKINYESKMTPHAFFKKSIEKTNERINNIEKFVKRYPLYDWYTAPLLKELFDYYENKKPEIALDYAIMLKEYVQKHPEEMYKKYYSEKVRKYLTVGDKIEFRPTE